MISRNRESTSGLSLDITLGRLQTLEKQERILIGLYFYERLSVEEIAIVLQQSSDSIQTMLDGIFPKLFPELAREKVVQTLSQETLG